MSELFDTKEHDVYSDDAELVQLVGLKLGDEEYAIDVLKIQEIIRTVEITVVPRMESFILGVMNLRGKVIPVIDLRVRFNLERCDFDKSTRIIVVRFEKQYIGFVVDEVTEVIRIRRSMVEPTPPLIGSIGQEYILGICKYEARLIMLLDIDRVLNESGEQIESDLRRKMLGTTKPQIIQPVEQAAKPILNLALDEHDDSDEHEERGITISTYDELPNPDKVEAPIISVSVFEDDESHQSGDSDSGVADDIDSMIAKELAMREAETVELNKKKRVPDHKESADDILADALAQSSAIFKNDSQYIEQGDLDSLIAKELAVRESETEELNRKHRSEQEKKTDLEIVAIISDKNINQPLQAEIAGAGKHSAVMESADQKLSIMELKQIAGKIISGVEPESLDINIKGEIGELLRLIIETKAKVDEINPVLQVSQETFPTVTSVLEDVNSTTEAATINLMEASDRMSQFYKSFIADIKHLKTLAGRDREKLFFELYEKICGNLSNAEELGFKILEALEFQDITEQKLRKVIKSIEDMGARIGTIVGFLQVNQAKGASDKRMGKLLTDYGLA